MFRVFFFRAMPGAGRLVAVPTVAGQLVLHRDERAPPGPQDGGGDTERLERTPKLSSPRRDEEGWPRGGTGPKRTNLLKLFPFINLVSLVTYELNCITFTYITDHLAFTKPWDLVTDRSQEFT